MENVISLPSAVFSTEHSPKLSPTYNHINTAQVMEKFQDMGWFPAAANSAKHSKAPQYARHTVRMRHKDFAVAEIDATIPEIILLNSHNGTWALRIALGMFRMVCSNGMVAGNVWEGEVIRHSRVSQLDEKILQITQNMGTMANNLTDRIRHWSQLEVSPDQALQFAKQAKQIRWGERDPVDSAQLLEARRSDDEGRSLWKVFNRVQENLTRGGYSGITTSGRSFAVKAISNAKRDFNYNRQLFSLANDLATELEAA